MLARAKRTRALSEPGMVRSLGLEMPKVEEAWAWVTVGLIASLRAARRHRLCAPLAAPAPKRRARSTAAQESGRRWWRGSLGFAGCRSAGRPRCFSTTNEEFAEVVRQKLEAQAGQASESGVRQRRVLLGLRFSEPSADRGTTPEAVQREQLVAFYDQTTHVVARARGRHARAGCRGFDRLDRRARDRPFAPAPALSIPDLDKLADDDAALAALSMLEGDAMLTMLAFIATAATSR